MYDKTDPRSTLTNAAVSSAGGALSEPEYGRFYAEAPVEDDANGRTWYVRGQNFIIAYSDAAPGAVFERRGQPDEYMVLLPDADTPAVATADTNEERVDGYSLLIMPPGNSQVTLPRGGRVIRILSSRARDLAVRCPNAASYAKQHPTIPPLQNWPEPPAGYRVRAYSLDVPAEQGRFGRIWRCTTIMVNVPEIQKGPRDPARVSPHAHADFEQCSLALAGTWKHHLRWPWTTDMNDWRADVHAEVGSPSVTVIPAQVLHTSTWHSDINQLVDIFSPPRVDFSQKPGWVLNADEYPAPAMVHA